MNRRVFFDAVRAKPFGGSLSIPQVDGMGAILDEWDRRGLKDLRWLAYMLATTYHETARTMQPIGEFGKGKGRKYGTPVGPHRKVYYGRGFVQLTWLENYEKAGKAVGVDLVKFPEKALEPAIAAAIMFDGMIEGWFAGDKAGRHTLPRYFNATKADWSGARRIINGTDKAALIAGYGTQFHAALLAASKAKLPTEIVEASPPPPDISAPERPQVPVDAVLDDEADEVRTTPAPQQNWFLRFLRWLIS